MNTTMFPANSPSGSVSSLASSVQCSMSPRLSTLASLTHRSVGYEFRFRLCWRFEKQNVYLNHQHIWQAINSDYQRHAELDCIEKVWLWTWEA